MKQQPTPDLSSFSSRLRHLHNVISMVPDEQFDLKYFSYNIPECGTVGCAVGWATQDPAFQAVGFRAECSNGWLPEYEHYETGFESIEAFFGLGGRESGDLFIVSSYTYPTNRLTRGKYKQEFLNRLEGQIEKAKVKERITHEATVSA